MWRACAVVLAVAAPVFAQSGSVRYARVDLAEAYLAFERAYKAHPPGESAADINKAFDDATLRFFSGQGPMRVLRETTDRLRFGSEITPNQAFASSLRIVVKPMVVNQTVPEPAVLRVTQMYDVPAVGAVNVRIYSPTGRVVFEQAVTGAEDVQVDAAEFGVGTHRVRIELEGEPRFESRLVVTERSLDEIREEMLKEVGETERPSQAVAAFCARARLLTDSPSTEESAQFMADPIELREELAKEAAAIKDGKDPYVGRVGDYWRVFSYKGVEIPCRVFVPRSVNGKAAPLVMALHGAGGDENIWLDGYGAGELKHQAEKHGLIVLSPRTELLLGNVFVFEALLEAARELYTIDRVYLIGHSMGAMAATGLCSLRPESVNGACLIAGLGRFPSAQKLPPILVVSGELDPMMKPNQVRAGVAAAKRDGHRVDLRMLGDRGHTLLVGEELPRAIEWLLRQK